MECPGAHNKIKDGVAQKFQALVVLLRLRVLVYIRTMG
jgi:hypothetical protein